MKYIEINVNGYNKIYTIGNADIKKKVREFAEDDKSSVHYLPVLTSKGETLKLQWDSKRTIKILPDYLESEVSGEIVEVGDSFISKVHLKNRMYYL